MNPSARIRVLCVDDHPIVRDGLAGIFLLQPDMELVGEAGSGQDAIELYQKLQPDVVLLDLRLRDMTGYEVMQQIFSTFPGAKVLVLTSLEGDADIERALALGARGYVVKGTGRDELVRAVRAVSAGKKHVPVDVAQRLAEHFASEKLSSRELEVLTLMAHGKRNKEIGAELSIAEDTVKMHVKNILGKLAVNDRTEAVTIALRRGILHL
ncbi:response regulator transcription factor [Alloacidobacterium dinghuense]|uniref:Response regulator transcription factor n=1 Tax=Alloacidobacterium dinghuense TaxID=2763107 RepID=A0A7G8BJ50_9BACT|nr:response regulator transcription factor [Alloacidobacterium dinghuense]QNI32570.1 response regulator transcription factor [Alloacidobacterium dinghuense]